MTPRATPAEPAKDRLGRLFAEQTRTPASSATLPLPRDAVDLWVENAGRVTVPVRAPGAKKLIAAARPAMFGKGEETIFDADVRDTWEITPDQVKLGGPRWDAHLSQALEEFRSLLGLPAGSQLRAELHSMLIYGKGQFFLPHQDSEKHDHMVATMVLSLPSIHTGGELIIDDAGTEKIYQGSRDHITLVAFYADRRHEVKPVRSGYRVTLTFNLLLENKGPLADGTEPQEQASESSDNVRQTAGLLTEHFTTQQYPRYGGEPFLPTRLAFLLDHEYSQRGLSVSRLKGVDAQRAQVLLAAADQAGCEAVLALAEIAETRDAGVEDWDGPAWPGDDEPLDEEIRLEYWTDGSSAEAVDLRLSDDEVTQATLTRALEPYESEYEGYMGNYGNTVERWYRRACIVMWPREKAFTARAEAGSGWALNALEAEIAAGDLNSAQGHARSLEPFWRNVDAGLLEQALDVAGQVYDAEAAAVLLAPFSLGVIRAEHASALYALFSSYGSGWWKELLERWAPAGGGSGHRVEMLLMLQRRAPVHVPNEWVFAQALPLSQALRKQGPGGEECADLCVAQIWAGQQERVKGILAHSRASHRDDQLTQLGDSVGQVLKAASAEQSADMTGWLLDPAHFTLSLLLPVLEELEPVPLAGGESPLDERWVPLATVSMEALAELADAPERHADDWSIPWSGCGCGDCEDLARFLDSAARTKEWPLAKPRRQHLHILIDDAELPVTHTTKREGSPHKLMLTKTPELFTQAALRKARAISDREWLGELLAR